MARVLRHIDVRDAPDLARIANEVQTTHEPSVLKCDDEISAVVVTATPRFSVSLASERVQSPVFLSQDARTPG